MLKEKTRLLDLFIQNTPASIAMLDKDMRYIFASNRWLQDYRLDLGDIVGRSHYELFPEIPERWKEIHRRCLAGATERCDEDPFPRQDGQTDWLRWEVLPWLDNADEIGGIIITSELITEQIQARQALRASEERMIQAQKLESLGVLVAGVAHNFNNIMAIIMGTASMQEGVVTDPDQLEALRIIIRACERGRGLVKSLTHFGKPSLETRAPVELHNLITEVRILLGNATRNRTEIMAEFAPEPLWILADSGSLSTVLMCLCLNSLDAMPEGGTLSLRTAVSGPGWVEVSVADDGEGMTPEVLARATEPFFTTKPVGKGSGLGLSMTHGVVKAHGGTLAITSDLGQGTQVKLLLPRIAAPAGEADPDAPPPGSRPMQVLVVDDEEEVRSLMARMLGKAGATQGSGAQADSALWASPLPGRHRLRRCGPICLRRMVPRRCTHCVRSRCRGVSASEPKFESSRADPRKYLTANWIVLKQSPPQFQHRRQPAQVGRSPRSGPSHGNGPVARPAQVPAY
jgi:PAS domain S-box-containing protein